MTFGKYFRLYLYLSPVIDCMAAILIYFVYKSMEKHIEAHFRSSLVPTTSPLYVLRRAL